MKMKELTRAEEEVMQVLWNLEQAFVKDIIAEMPPDRNRGKPAYNTVSTIVRILQDKGLVSHKPIGKSHRYFPLITKEDYSKHKMDSLVSGYFEGSLSKMVSFFVDRKNLDSRELDEILEIINQKKS